jgi:hypothetical protein
MLPTILFVALSQSILVYMLPSEWINYLPFQNWDVQWQVVLVLFLIVILSGILHNLNSAIIRLYEGYPWKQSKLGDWCIQAQRRELQVLKAREEVLRQVQLAIGNDKDDLYQEANREFTEIGRKRNGNFPNDESLILPTRLGNAFRSFEYYPDHQYKMDAVMLWRRLVAVMSKEYGEAINNDKAYFDFTLNCSFLSYLLSVGILGAFLSHAYSFATKPLIILWIGTSIFFFIIGYWFYVIATGRAKEYGDAVKGAFDLYRGDLLKQFGYSLQPQTRQSERVVWGKISRQMIFGDGVKGARIEYTEVSEDYPVVQTEPQEVRVEIARGVQLTSNTRIVKHFIKIKNVDAYKVDGTHMPRDISTLTVQDYLSDEFSYEWDSAMVLKKDIQGQNVQAQVHVEGTNPFTFHLGNLPYEEEVVLEYNAARVNGIAQVGE